MVFHAQHMGVIIAAMNAASWMNDKMNEWLGEKNVADVLSQSVSNNITSEMGLALLDVADVIRPYKAIIAFLQQVKDGKSEEEIRKSWEPALGEFKKMRKKYLLYPDFE
jgi:pyruvate,water dikinase